jgi:DNA-binding response OmpR family regulator
MTTAPPLRILYMEDDPGLARLVQKKLEREGFQVDLSPDGEQGLKRYAETQYDLVITDQEMPVYDGLEVIRRMAASGPLPPTLMVTGAGNESIAVEAMKLGASDYLVKDLGGAYFNLLPTVIRQALERRRIVVEKERAEQDLRNYMEQVTRTLESISDAFFSLNDQWTITYFNLAAETLLQRRRQDVLGQSLFDAFPELSGSVFEEQFSRVLREKLPLNFETYFERAPYVNWYDVRVYPQTGGLSVYFQVITQRKLVETERDRLINELQQALGKLKTLSGLLPICGCCKKIRDDRGYWNQLETYIEQHSQAEFSHGICPDCMKKLYPNYRK